MGNSNRIFTAADLDMQIKLIELMDSLSMGVLVTDSMGNVIAVNPAAGTILGLEPNSLRDKQIEEIFPGCDLSTTGSRRFSKVGILLDLGQIEVLLDLAPLKVDERIIGAVAIFRDTSNMGEMTIKLNGLRESAYELNAIFENSYDGIYASDANGMTVRVNSAFQRVTGLPLEKIIGRNIKDILRDGLISESIAMKVLEQKKTVSIKQKVIGGKEFLVTGSPMLNEKGEIVGVVSNVRDMPELTGLQKELEHTIELVAHYEREISQLKYKYEGKQKIIGQSKLMQNVVALAERISQVDTTVLILGESGVGKELIAQLIHENSTRAAKRAFIKVNCGAIPGDLLESELFGYEEGAFTGARKGGKAGLFEIADKGTLFLDEIGDLPLNMQVKLLRVLQEGELTRVGSTKSVKIDVRLISATNKDLYNMVMQGSFRQDLYYRLNVVPLIIPPLKDRKEDILPLTVHYLDYFNQKYKADKGLSPKVINLFMNYDWPGNIRELTNTLERLVVLVIDDIIKPEDLPSQFILGNKKEIDHLYILSGAVSNLEKTMIAKALRDQKTTRKAAKLLGISQSALMKKIKKYGIRFEEAWMVNN